MWCSHTGTRESVLTVDWTRWEHKHSVEERPEEVILFEKTKVFPCVQKATGNALTVYSSQCNLLCYGFVLSWVRNMIKSVYTH